jgi:hypothetical protein
MNGFIKRAGLGLVLAATTLSAAAPADAQRYRGYRGGRGGGDVAAGAILGGILGLGVGAAIASNNRGRYVDRGYYYDAPPPPRVVYRQRFYAPVPVYRDRYYAPRRYYAPAPVYRDPYYAPRGYYGY